MTETEPITVAGTVAGTGPAGCAGVDQPSDKLRDFLKGLASEQRQQMMELFTGGVELTVGTVAERLGIGQSTASQQLALLRRGGLLTSRRDGKQVHYRVDVAAVEKSLDELRDYLRRCCPPEDVC
ncbi:metalloregulator ArsR/SmtB family transcription factor [Actinomadura sp. HBU206391]|uniref:ArsR/SmtB family transcription factor n=1 Tax=Actinomadura sp. HBU206391 TaxID=2731692 RepID=UPI002905BB59|nr:metalloregulator ArsR/SmtB family transcription factor [Actinomadura sp. HBU206391]